MDFRLRPSLSFHLGLDGLDGENNGNDHEGNHGNHEQEDENFRIEKVRKDFDVNANETHCHYYVNDIANTFENNVEDATFEDLTNSRMNNMAIRWTNNNHYKLIIHTPTPDLCHYLKFQAQK
jgi:hypothetical protein